MLPKTILVIEDNELNMKLVRSLLQLRKYTVLEAVDAEAGIMLAREKRPDAILMDIQLPGMDGLSATRILKGDPLLKDIVMIALPSNAMENDDKRAKEAGCDGYITKPINVREFAGRVESTLARAGGTGLACGLQQYRTPFPSGGQ